MRRRRRCYRRGDAVEAAAAAPADAAVVVIEDASDSPLSFFDASLGEPVCGVLIPRCSAAYSGKKSL